MFKKAGIAGLFLAAATGLALSAPPAQADAIGLVKTINVKLPVQLCSSPVSGGLIPVQLPVQSKHKTGPCANGWSTAKKKVKVH